MNLREKIEPEKKIAISMRVLCPPPTLGTYISFNILTQMNPFGFKDFWIQKQAFFQVSCRYFLSKATCKNPERVRNRERRESL